MYSTLALGLWLLGLLGATGGYAVGRVVFDRGVVYGADLPVLPDTSLPRRAVNTQLELEPDAESVRRSLRMLKAAGFGLIRQQFAWTAVEPSAKGQTFDTTRGRSHWERYDEIVRAAREEGIAILARLDLPPDWARPAGSYKTHPPVDVRDYADFVQTFVSRYKDDVRYVQLWNEPNLTEEWGRRPVDPAGYVELLRAGYEGAKRADPGIRVVSGALAQTLEPDHPSASGLDDLVYLDRMYLHGARPFFDVLAANAYGLESGPDDRRAAPAEANFPRVLLVRDVMRRHADDGKAVWVAEFGWNALPADWQGDPSPWGQVRPELQADYIQGAYDRAAAEWPWMGPMALWLFRKPGADVRDPTPFFALVDQDWRPRPAYNALARSAAERALPVGVHQDSAPELTYGGTWQWTPDSQASMGEMRESPISGATVRWRFRGTQVDLIAPVGPSRGVAYVKINGAYTLANRLPLNANGQATVDFYAPENRPRQRITLASGLPDRVHDVELTVTGERSAASTGSGVGVDAIAVARSRPAWPLYAIGAAWAATLGLLVWRFRPVLPLPLVVPDAGTLASGEGSPAARQSAGLVTAARIVTRVVDPRPALLLLAALLPFAPLAIRTPGGTYSPVELCAVVAIGLFMVRAFLHPYTRLRWGAYAGPALLLLCAGALSTIVADYPRLALRELRTLVVEPVLVYFIARSVLRGQRDALHLALAFLLGAGAASALALFQSLTGQGLVAAEGVARAAALYRSPNNLGLLLGRGLPLALACALYGPGALRLFFWLASALCGAALFFTFSRGAWLASGAATLLVCVPLLRRSVPALSRRQLWLIALAALPLAAGAIAVAARFERFRSLFSAAGTGFLRFHLWGSSLRMALDHALAGVGLDQFLYHYPRYMHPDAWREPNLSHPHNLVLDFWLRLGLLGLVALAWGALAFLRRRRAPGSQAAALHLGAAGALAAFAIHGLVDNSYFLIDLAYATWLILLVRELAADPEPAVRQVSS